MLIFDSAYVEEYMSPANRARHEQSLDPFALYFALCDFCMPELTANAWKIVSYVGRLSIQEYAAQVRAANDPRSLLISDIVNAAPRLAASFENPQKSSTVKGIAVVPSRASEFPEFYFPISLQDFCTGRRSPDGKRRLDGGTGLVKSSVTDAINVAIQKEVLERKKQTRNGETHASLYRIRWEKVFEFQEKLKKRPAKIQQIGRPIGGPRVDR